MKSEEPEVLYDAQVWVENSGLGPGFVLFVLVVALLLGLAMRGLL